MSRPIKFRAWIPSQKVMFQVGLIDENTNTLGERTACFPVRTWRLNEEAVLMQFTGLHDKNGNEIWEGDIVKWGHVRSESHESPVRIAEVKFCPDIQFHSQVGIFKFGAFSYASSTHKDLEVLGNIYESPELLKNA